MALLVQTIGNFQEHLINKLKERWLVWLRLGFVLLTPLISAGLGFVAAKRNPKYALVAALLPIIFVGLEIMLRKYQYTQVVILVTALFVPFSLPTGTGSRLVFSLVFTIVFVVFWVLRMMLVEKRIWLYPSPANFPLLGFIVVTVISLGWSILFRDPLVESLVLTWGSFQLVQVASTVMIIMLPLAFLLAANYIHWEYTLKLMVGIMVFAGVLGLFRMYGRLPIPVNTDGLFAMWVITLSMGLALYNKQLPRWGRWLLTALAMVWVYWGLGLHISWLAGWLPGVVVVATLTFFRSKRLAVLISIAVLIIIAINARYYFGTVLQSENQVSGETRVAAWKMNWRITSQHLLFGTGPAGYTVYYMAYFPNDAMATHSNYIDVLAQTGIIGFAFCIWFFFGLAWHGYRLIVRLRGRGDFMEAAANAAFAGTIGCILMMGFGDWLFPFAYTQTISGFNYAVYNWIFMGMLLVIERLTKEQAPANA